MLVSCQDVAIIKSTSLDAQNCCYSMPYIGYVPFVTCYAASSLPNLQDNHLNGVRTTVAMLFNLFLLPTAN